MSSQPDPEAILTALGITGATSVEPVSGGSDTLIWRVEHEAMLYALRLFRAEQDEMCLREEQVMRAAAQDGLPVPHVYTRGRWKGRPALLLEWCPGKPMAHELLARPWRAWLLGLLFGRTQAKMHRLRAPRILQTPERSWLEWMPANETSLRNKLLQTEHSPDTLLHLDYHLLNVMTDGKRVTAVLDWANARSGDPRADWARALTILRLDSEVPGPLRLPTRLVVRVFELGWRRGYRQVAGPLPDLAPFMAWAGVVMEHDLAPRPGRHRQLSPGQLRRIRHWTARWKERAGCT